MGAIPELAEYLIQKHGLSFVLPGKFMSDPIEARFGWYRQLSGGNFYISVKQLFEAEKKIRTLTLLQQQLLLSASRLNEEYEESPHREASVLIPSSEVSWLAEFLSPVSWEDIGCNDANVVYFVSGYIGRSISRRRRCAACSNLLLLTAESPQVEDNVPPEYSRLFASANRGGLKSPTIYCFMVTALAVQCYTAIMANGTAKKKLLSVCNQRSAFIAAVTYKFEECSVDSELDLYCKCSAGHFNFELMIATAFNCFAKNELKRLNAQKIAPEPMCTNRKLRKLCGNGSAKK